MAGQRFNVVVARVMELVNATRKAIDTGAGPADPAVREAVEVVTVVLSTVAPYVSEEMWEHLGHAPSVADASWPVVDPTLLVAELGDLRRPDPGQGPGPAGRVAVDRTVAERSGAGAGRRGRAAAGLGRPVAKVIVRAPKLVSIVPL